RRRRMTLVRTGSLRGVGPRPLDGTGYAHARGSRRRRSARSPGAASPAGRTPRARTRAAAGPGSTGRTPPVSASCEPDRQSPRRSPGCSGRRSAGAAGPGGPAAGWDDGESSQHPPKGVHGLIDRIQMQPEHWTSPGGQHRGVPGRLRGDELAEGEVPAGALEYFGGVLGELEEETRWRSALLVLPGGVQEPRARPEG